MILQAKNFFLWIMWIIMNSCCLFSAHISLSDFHQASLLLDRLSMNNELMLSCDKLLNSFLCLLRIIVIWQTIEIDNVYYHFITNTVFLVFSSSIHNIGPVIK